MKNLLVVISIICLSLLSCAFGFNEKKRDNSFSNNINIKHPIDIEEEKCIKSSHVYDYPQCSEKAEKDWNKEIQNNLKMLKEIMAKEEFIYINEMNKAWEKSVYKEMAVINRFISSKDGIIYQTDANNQIVQIKKQYALLLQNLYYNYYKENQEFDY